MQVVQYCNLDTATPQADVVFTASDREITAFAFSRDGTLLAILNSLNEINIYKQGVLLSHMRAETKPSLSSSLAFGPDGQELALARDEVTFWRWQRYDYFNHLSQSDVSQKTCGP
jgi:hypothetical protein